MKLIQRIKIFGDSIMKGIMLDPADNRYRTIDDGFSLIKESYTLDINNRSIFGCTVTKGLQLLQRTKERGLECDMVLLEYGGNDCDFPWDEVANAPDEDHLPVTPLPLFESTYREMLADLHEQQVIPLMMSLPPIDGNRYLSWICRNGLNKDNILHWLGGDAQTITRYQELYSDKLTRIALETGTLFVDIRPSFLARRDFPDLLCNDGIHPTKAGHMLIASVFANFASHFAQAGSEKSFLSVS